MKKLIIMFGLISVLLCGCYDKGTKVGTYYPGNHYIPPGTQIVAAYGECQLYGVIVKDEEGNYYDVRFSNGDVTKLKFMNYAKIENGERNDKYKKKRR